MRLATVLLAGFLTGVSPSDRLLDDKDGFILVSDGVHTNTFLSHWGPDFAPTQSISAWLDVAADKSGVTIRVAAFDNTSAVVSTEIARVISINPFVAVTLQACPQFECDVKWLPAQMVDGPNEWVAFMTNATGARFGVYSRISKP